MIHRRDFLRSMSAAGTVALFSLHARCAGAEPPPETTKIRLARVPSICRAPQFVAEELLRSEGFTDVKYVTWRRTSDAATAVAAGDVDITMQYIGPSIMQVDAGRPIVSTASIARRVALRRMTATAAERVDRRTSVHTNRS